MTREAGATIFLASEDEWYKAAYYSSGGVYFDYPTGTDTLPTCAAPTADANHANCTRDELTTRGSYTGSASPYGTFDQGGNVWEWHEAIIFGVRRGLRAGSFGNDPSNLGAYVRISSEPAAETPAVGFRVASSIPEPCTGLLVIAGLLGLAGWRRVRA